MTNDIIIKFDQDKDKLILISIDQNKIPKPKLFLIESKNQMTYTIIWKKITAYI